jgi:vesicle-fusing ATPase
MQLNLPADLSNVFTNRTHLSSMSFFRSGNTNTPPPSNNSQYSRLPPAKGDLDYRSARRPMPSPSAQYAPQTGYNDPASAVFEKSTYSRKPAPPRPSGTCVVVIYLQLFCLRLTEVNSFVVVGSPSDALALTNCLVVHPSDFAQGTHVLVNNNFPLSVRYVKS